MLFYREIKKRFKKDLLYIYRSACGRQSLSRLKKWVKVSNDSYWDCCKITINLFCLALGIAHVKSQFARICKILQQFGKKQGTIFEKGAFFLRLWGYFWRLTIYFRIQPGFWIENSLLGCPNIFIFIYLDFLLSKILCYDVPELLHNST